MPPLRKEKENILGDTLFGTAVGIKWRLGTTLYFVMTPKGVWRPHFQSVLRKLCNTDKDGESIGIL